MKLKNRRELNLNQEQRERQQFVIYNCRLSIFKLPNYSPIVGRTFKFENMKVVF